MDGVEPGPHGLGGGGREQRPERGGGMPSPGTCTLEAQMTGGDAEAQRGTGFARGHRAREEHVAESPRESTCRSAFPTQGTNRHGFVSPDGGSGQTGGCCGRSPRGPSSCCPVGAGVGAGEAEQGSAKCSRKRFSKGAKLHRAGFPAAHPPRTKESKHGKQKVVESEKLQH